MIKRKASKMSPAVFRKTFRAKRIKAGVTISNVADHIGKSSGIVRFVETGFRKPGPETRAKMEKVLASNFKGL